MLSTREGLKHGTDVVAAAPIVDPSTIPILICLLGDFRVLKNGQPITLRGNGKVETLLRMLALHLSVSRDALLEVVWPHTNARLAIQSLHSLLYNLHKSLGDAIGGLAPVTHAAGYFALNDAAGVRADVRLFDALASQSDEQTRAGDRGGGIVSCIRALQLYRGDLDGVTDPDAVIERERLRARYLHLLARMTDFYYAKGDYAACMDCAARLLKSDPYYEEAYRVLMRCHVKQGARSLALRQYQVCRDILHAEFDSSPEPATQALFEHIRCDAIGI